MALIIEDGTIVAGANSFTTDAELTTYAAARGLTLPGTEAERDILQIKAVDFIAYNENAMQGVRSSSEQSLPFPRSGVVLFGYSVGSDVIPSTLKSAQLEAAILVNSTPLLNNETLQNIQREKLDTLEVAYFNGGKRTKTNFQSIYNYLGNILQDSTKLVRT